jgi:hypothetical protein
LQRLRAGLLQPPEAVHLDAPQLGVLAQKHPHVLTRP